MLSGTQTAQIRHELSNTWLRHLKGPNPNFFMQSNVESVPPPRSSGGSVSGRHVECFSFSLFAQEVNWKDDLQLSLDLRFLPDECRRRSQSPGRKASYANVTRTKAASC